jgi:hypothetical protein
LRHANSFNNSNFSFGLGLVVEALHGQEEGPWKLRKVRIKKIPLPMKEAGFHSF